ncbi:FAD-dependent oxidoreductase [Aquamicrobium sp. LC103]|uniref:FAD-dependent oxidoreductase n=1 Tax=Aquamicrobium sp. LC103 TaxID=1120658 RepID=UPI00063EA36E|nr:FAD-dependent oxidoreductase [Aquamicrobium sp. LC103]TKT74570.1 GMC family oxidoreductase [Aquamicrobium sp. LC103]
MLTDFSDVSQLPESPEIVIVGAGAVGLTMAVDLARRGKQVLLLEAGGRDVDGMSQNYFESAACIGRQLAGLHEARVRALGGTTNLWGGQLVRLDPIVFENRDWLGAGGWPIKGTDLDSAYERAFDLFGMQRRLEDREVWERLTITPPETGKNLEFFFTRWTPEPNFAKLFARDIARLDNLRVVANAPVVGLWSDENGKQIGVVVAHGDGKHRLRAQKLVLAHGTIEIARLLSMPLTNSSMAPWAGNPWLGRGFSDHVDAYAGKVALLDRKRFHQLFDAAVLDGLKYLPKLKLTEGAQREGSFLGIAAHFVSESANDEELIWLKGVARDLLNRKIDGRVFRGSRRIVSLTRAAIPVATRYLRHRRIYNPGEKGIRLRLTSEQIGLSRSGLRLADKADPLGMPIVEMNWQIDGAELETMASFAIAVANFLQREGLAEIDLDNHLLDRDPAFLSRADDGYHHMGMARMAASPADGVVDADLRVFGTDNLFVAGAAAFRSTGFANPTLTGVALGLRLSEALQNGKA